VGHGLNAVYGGDGADEDSAGFAGEMGGCVDAVVHAVDEVYVGAAGWAEEGEVVGGEAAVGVGGGVGEAEVGLDLGDVAGEPLAVEIADEELAEEGSGYDLGGARVEAPWEKFEHECPPRLLSCSKSRKGAILSSQKSVTLDN